MGCRGPYGRGVDELTSRPYRAGDGAALAELFNLIDAAAGGHPGFTGEMVGEFFGLARDPAADSRVTLSGDRVVAAAVVPTPPGGGFRVDLWGGVHPDWRGRGLGRDLLGWQLARSREIHRAVAADAPWEAHVGALIDDKATLRLCERFGMRVARYWFEMVAPTTPPAVPVPVGLRVTAYDGALESALHEAHMEAFADHWGYQRRPREEWVRLSVGSEDFDPSLSRVAFDGDEIVGYVLSYRDAAPDRLYIGQVGTRRPWRRRGLAAALMAQVLAAAGAAGKRTAALGVDADSPTGAVGVYERVGFAVESRAVTYALPLAAEDPDPGGPAADPDAGGQADDRAAGGAADAPAAGDPAA
jgi:mycothiol synthase